MKLIYSFRFRLIYYFSGITIISILALVSAYNVSYNASLKKNILNNATSNLSYIVNTINVNFSSASMESLWISSDRDIVSLLSAPASRVAGLKADILATQRALEQMIWTSILGKYILSISIIGDNGVYFNVSKNTFSMTKQDIINSAETMPLLEESYGGISWKTVIPNPSSYDPQKYFVLPIVLPVTDVAGKKLGYCFICFDEKIISKVFSDYGPPSESVFFVITQDGVCISNTDSSLMGKKMDGEEINKILETKNGNMEIGQGRGRKLLIYKTLGQNLIVVQTINLGELLSRDKYLSSTTLGIILILALATLLFQFILSNALTKPIQAMLIRLDEIAHGKFHVQRTEYPQDELSVLEQGIDEMAVRIEGLIQQKVLQEREKRDLELKVLQSQINPHFLYNTLNSIKFMANIQQAKGISECVGALARLLRTISKHKTDEITIEEELSLTKDYFFIQRIRYNGSIDLHITLDDKRILNQKILKFSFQPIIENAIFHGIEPKNAPGNIHIHIYERQPDILIDILDDGVGMDQACMETILSGKETKQSAFMSIGIRNVHERLKLTYGVPYGLTFESALNSYTKVTIRIPMQQIGVMEKCTE